MATLLLAAAGSAIGGSIGGTILGVSTAAIGQAIGAYVGSVIDQRLMGGLGTTRTEGTRLDDLSMTAAEEGGDLPEVWGRMAVGGTVIWAAELREEEVVETETVRQGKKKGKVENVSYEYYASFAVSLSEGEIAGIGRIWLDGEIFDDSDMWQDGRLRLYRGTEYQVADGLISSIEGSTPAFRGTAYLVFEDLPVNDYGNRIPTVKVEVYGKSGELERMIRGVNLIPGSTEAGYDPKKVNSVSYDGSGDVISEVALNRARISGTTDFYLAMNQLYSQLPSCDTVSLVVAWFGTDLRAGLCEIEPRAEYTDRDTEPRYLVAGLRTWSDDYDAPGSWDRINQVSRVDGTPAYGSTPSDGSVIRAIAKLRQQGRRVVLYPFVMMDVQAAQGLPDPAGTGTQPDYPWRGRLEPRSGQPVASEVAAFMGSATAADFGEDDGAVDYSGPSEWRFRRFILHLAKLADIAGGVDAMLIGSEMRGLSFATDAPGVYPFVDALRDLAAEVRAILPGAAISYAADWSEYHSHRVGSEIHFHLDPLWADANIDFVGIDNYLPLSDWRSGTDHLDYDPAGPVSVYDLDYLSANIEGGEYWDWYYASDADRAAQIRTAIYDGAYGEDWVWRQKAIRDWWGNAHHDRPGGVRSATATAWVAGSKPVWFTELGCAAIDKGANQPNVFVARHSSESALPWYSNGARDDAMQRAYLTAMLSWWGDNGGSAVSVANIQIWCWDVRPFPEFPSRDYWGDWADWRRGHWISGRVGGAPLRELCAERIERYGLTANDLDLTRAWAVADGYAVPVCSFRDMVQPYEIAMAAQFAEAGGKVIVEDRRSPIVLDAIYADVAVLGDGDPWTRVRKALEDLPGQAVLKFVDGGTDYSVAAAIASVGAGRATGTSTATTSLALSLGTAWAAAEAIMRSALAANESISIALPRSVQGLRPGVVLPVDTGDGARAYIIDSVTVGESATVEATSWSDAAWSTPIAGPSRAARSLPSIGSSAVMLVPIDLPIIPGLTVNAWDGYFAAHAAPWPGSAAVIQATSATGSGDILTIAAAATIGETVSDLASGEPWCWTDGTVDIRLYRGSLPAPTTEESDVLDGANALAIEHAGGWEVIQFRDAELIGANTWRISRLIRGVRGTDPLSADVLPAGARVVRLTGAVKPAGLAEAERGRSYWWRYGSAYDDPDDYSTVVHAFAGVGLRPFAPAHLTATPDGSGGLDLSWVRRSRSTDVYNPAASPALSEASERYRIEIGPAGSPARVIETTTPATTWSAAMIAADALSAPVRISVQQVSEAYGPGWAAEIEVTP